MKTSVFAAGVATVEPTDEEQPSMASYLELPSRPFKNFLPRRGRSALVDKKECTGDFHRDAVMMSLQRLQDKMFRLELDQNAAECGLKSLAADTAICRELLTLGGGRGGGVIKKVSVPPQTVPVQHLDDRGLQRAEHRVAHMESQLEYLRDLVKSAELQHDFDVLHLRRTMDTKFCKMEALLRKDAQASCHQVQSRKVLHGDQSVKISRSIAAPRSPPFPFVVGSSGTSHHLGANLQTVLALIKQRHKTIKCDKNKSVQVAASDVDTLIHDLEETLANLQVNHRALLHMLSICNTNAESLKLIEQLAELGVAMETKGQALGQLRAHQIYMSQWKVEEPARTLTTPNDNRKVHCQRRHQKNTKHSLQLDDLCWE